MNGELVAPAAAACELAPDPPILVAGHSHMCALVGDLHTVETRLHPVADHPNVFALHAPWPRQDEYWQHLKASAAGMRIALIWNGNEHNIHYFFLDQRPFDFVSRHVNKLVPTFSLIPQRRIRQKFREASVDELAAILADLAAGPAKSINVVGTPPPKKDNEELRKILRNEPVLVNWAEFVGQSLDEIKITPPYVRLKLWFLLQEMVADAARQIGAKFIPVPQEVQDEDGFLKPEYWHPDVTHANRLYGDVMLRRIIQEAA